jgi:hypothetical protein
MAEFQKNKELKRCISFSIYCPNETKAIETFNAMSLNLMNLETSFTRMGMVVSGICSNFPTNREFLTKFADEHHNKQGWKITLYEPE